LLDVVSRAQARFRLASGAEAVVQVPADADVEGPVFPGDGVLDIESEFFHVRMSVEREQATAASQIERQQHGIEQGELGSIRSVYIRCHVLLKASGRALILCGAREQPLRLIQQTEFEELVGPENICDNVQEALSRAEEAFERLQPAGQGAGR